MRLCSIADFVADVAAGVGLQHVFALDLVQRAVDAPAAVVDHRFEADLEQFAGLRSKGPPASGFWLPSARRWMLSRMSDR